MSGVPIEGQPRRIGAAGYIGAGGEPRLHEVFEVPAPGPDESKYKGVFRVVLLADLIKYCTKKDLSETDYENIGISDGFRLIRKSRARQGAPERF